MGGHFLILLLPQPQGAVLQVLGEGVNGLPLPTLKFLVQASAAWLGEN